MRRSEQPFVYFIRRADGEGPIKIGCSHSPEVRLSALMQWAPYPLAILATIPGDERLEWAFHAHFQELHSHREWFHVTPALEAVVEAVKAGTFDVAALPPPRRIDGRRLGNGWSEETRRGAGWRRRLYHLERRGVSIPPEVRFAAYRWSAGKYFEHYDRHNPRDAETVEAFLAEHPPAKRQRRAA